MNRLFKEILGVMYIVINLGKSATYFPIRLQVSKDELRNASSIYQRIRSPMEG